MPHCLCIAFLHAEQVNHMHCISWSKPFTFHKESHRHRHLYSYLKLTAARVVSVTVCASFFLSNLQRYLSLGMSIEIMHIPYVSDISLLSVDPRGLVALSSSFAIDAGSRTCATNNISTVICGVIALFHWYCVSGYVNVVIQPALSNSDAVRPGSLQKVFWWEKRKLLCDIR